MLRTPRRHAPLVLACLLVTSLVVPVAAPVAGEDDASKTGYIEMPPSTDGSYVLVSPHGSGRAWGKPEMIRFLTIAAKEWKKRHPEGPVLRIGDIAKPDGSNFPPHKTHKDGISMDLTTRGPNICHINHEDQEQTLELARLLVSLGARQILYNGKKVIDAVPEARAWEKHDDHFHIVIVPERVPMGDQPIVVPAAGVGSGAWIGTEHVKDDRTGLRLAWQAIGVDRGWAKTAKIEVQTEGGEALHESEEVAIRRPRYELPIALEDGKAYRWRVTLTPSPRREGAEPATSAWTTFRADFAAPSVEVIGPKGGGEVSGKPKFTWKLTDQGSGKQSRYQIELAKDARRKKIARLDPVDGAAAEHTLELRVPPDKELHWRVVVWDAAGNRAESDWAVFRTAP